MKILHKVSIVAVTVGLAIGLAGLSSAATTTVNLGTADAFAILAGSTITNTGSSVITGDLGLSPGTSVTGFPPGTVSGTQHVADTTAVAAKTALVTAYNDAAGRTPVTTVPTELGGTTKTAGVYGAGTLGITGTLTLDAQGDASAVFIFKAASTLITAGSSTVSLVNGAQACNVFWQVGSSATLGTNSTFKGNIMALTTITLTTGANVQGRVLARNGAVTLDTNIVTRAVCATATNTNTTVANTNTAVANTNTTVANTNTAVANTNAAATTNTTANTNSAVTSVALPNTGVGPKAHSNVPWLFLGGLAVMTLAGLLVGRKQIFSRR